MRTNKIALVLIFSSLLLSKNAHFIYSQDFSNAGEYMNYINNVCNPITGDVWDYTRAVAHGKSARKVEKRRKEIMNSTLEAKKKISKMPGFEGDNSLRDSVLEYLSISYIVLNEDYAKILDMEEIAEQSYDKMEAYMMAREMADQKQDIAGQMMEDEQKRFADKHNIHLQENKDKVSVNLKVANKVFKYYNVVYLIFFKNNKQEAYLVDAIGKNDINALEQNKNKLIEYSDEGLKKIDTMKAFRGDGSIKTACKQILEFYNTEASKKIPELTNFYLKRDNFEKIKTAFDAKRESERTKDDVDLYNKAASDYNAAAKEFNTINNDLNQTRAKLIDNWNKTSQNFTDSHVN